MLVYSSALQYSALTFSTSTNYQLLSRNIMSILDSLTTYGFGPRAFFTVAGAVIGAAALVHILSYLIDRHGIRRYPGPLLARLSNAWLASIAVQGKVNVAIHEAHEKYGKCC